MGTLVEAHCPSPLVGQSPLKRTINVIDSSTAPPLSPRTCQCSPMAVVNPSLRTTNTTSTTTKQEDKLEDYASTIKILQTQLDDCEQVKLDLLEENKLLRSLQEN